MEIPKSFRLNIFQIFDFEQENKFQRKNCVKTHFQGFQTIISQFLKTTGQNDFEVLLSAMGGIDRPKISNHLIILLTPAMIKSIQSLETLF